MDPHASPKHVAARPRPASADDAAPSATRSPIHAQLRGRTAALHAQVERQFDLLAPELTRSRYRRALQTLYGFYVPVEARLWPASAGLLPRELPPRARAEWLARDLRALGASPAELAGLPRCTDLPPLHTTEDLAGCLYVLEGATLGGQVIARGLRQRLGIGVDEGAAFFVGDWAATGPRWKQLLGWLDRLARSGAHGEAIASAACDTFAALSRWLHAQHRAQGEVR